MGKDKKKKPAKPVKQTKERTQTKNRKSPRGLKLKKVVNRLADEVVKPHARNRNAYNHRMAQVAKLAKLL